MQMDWIKLNRRSTVLSSRTISEEKFNPDQIKILPFRRRPVAAPPPPPLPVLPSVKEKKFEMVVNGYLRDGRRTRN